MSDAIATVVPQTPQATGFAGVLQTVNAINDAASGAGIETAKTHSEVSTALQIAQQLVAGGHVTPINAFAGFLLAIEGGLIKL